MFRTSMNEMTTYRWSFAQDVRNYVTAGYSGIGVWRQKLADYGEQKGIDLLRKCSLPVSSVLWAGGFTGSDCRTYGEAVRDACEAIRLAADLDAECLVVYSGARGGHTRNHAHRLARNAIRQLIPHAEEFGVTLALEPMHEGCGADWTFLSDLDETLHFLNAIGSPCLKLAFDTYHLCQDGLVLQRLAALVEHIAIVHLGDAKHAPCGEQDRCRLGEGLIPLKEIIGTLSDAGYQGFYEVELMGQELEGCDYHDLLAQSKEVVDSFVGASL